LSDHWKVYPVVFADRGFQLRLVGDVLENFFPSWPASSTTRSDSSPIDF